MFLLSCSRLRFSCLLFASAVSHGVFAQSSTPQNSAPVVAPPTATKQWTGDLDALLKHQVIRVGVPYSKSLYYTVKGVQYGVAYEGGKAFEGYLNKKYRGQQHKNIKIYVIFMVTPRDKAVSSLNDGYLDILIGDLVITPERQKRVDFSDPTVNGINEIVVTGPNSPQLASVDDLSGKEVFVRKTSSYWEHLERLNERFQKEKKPAVKLKGVPEDLSDEDLLQMVNAGLLPTIVVNDWMAKLWSQLLTKLQIHSDIVVASGATLGWAVRKDSPKLLAIINEFVKTHRQGTVFGNKVLTEYTGSTYMLKQAVSPEGMKRFERTEEEFRKYSEKYGVDYLLMMADGYQESGLNQNVKSPVGAIGVMQLMPETGAEMKVGDIHQEDANIHAGIKYFRSMMDRLYSREPMDDLNKVLFTLAAYNCGPDRVKALRAEAAAKGLNTNIWINNVEVIAAARIGAETVNYVSNIYKYYVAYKLIAMQEEQRRKARESFQEKPS
jgi:membrane-bound lytic murein transglycosylase MltF